MQCAAWLTSKNLSTSVPGVDAKDNQTNRIRCAGGCFLAAFGLGAALLISGSAVAVGLMAFWFAPEYIRSWRAGTGKAIRNPSLEGPLRV